MSRVLSEKKVLEKLGIDDFSQLTKEDISTLASMQDRISPEVSKKVIEQFPDFSNTMKGLLNGYKITLDKGLSSNNESIIRYYDTCNTIIASLEKQLDRRPLTFRKRKYIIDQMMELSNKMGEKDTENKKFILHFVTLGVSGLVAAATVVNKVTGRKS